MTRPRVLFAIERKEIVFWALERLGSSAERLAASSISSGTRNEIRGQNSSEPPEIFVKETLFALFVTTARQRSRK
ncbi:MAG TPA: hypothetical protein VFF30_05080 [Nitrososphaerales archaeon]|nr:hypothetical protein [Nitrososphaerales archaeon]